MKKVRVAYQGISGAYSQQAVLDFASENKFDFDAVSCSNFRELFDTIDKDTFLGMVPIENSNAGSVVECYDLFAEYDFEVLAEFFLEVRHCLLVKKGVKFSDVREVFSHPQALMQCSCFIEENGLVSSNGGDTAGSARFVSTSLRDDIGAISSKRAAISYGLEVLRENIQNSSDNTTRFFLVKKKGVSFDFENKIFGDYKENNKSTIIFETRNVPGALYKCLGAFATHGINLSKIESRPNKKKNFSYHFFVDVEDNLLGKNGKLALDELSFFSERVSILGRYRKGG